MSHWPERDPREVVLAITVATIAALYWVFHLFVGWSVPVVVR